MEQATQEAELAQKQTRTLHQQLETLLARQKELRDVSDEMGRELNADNNLPVTERQTLWNDRQTHPGTRPELLDRVNLRVLRSIQQTEDIRFAYWTVRSIPTPPRELDYKLDALALEELRLSRDVQLELEHRRAG